MTEHFTLIAGEPTPEFIAALKAVGITVHSWQLPRYRSASARHGATHRRRNAAGPIPTISGDLKLAAENRWEAFDDVLRIAAEHGVYVANGGMVSDL